MLEQNLNPLVPALNSGKSRYAMRKDSKNEKFRLDVGKNGENIMFDMEHNKPVFLDEFTDEEEYLAFMRSVMFISYEDEAILKSLYRSAVKKGE